MKFRHNFLFSNAIHRAGLVQTGNVLDVGRHVLKEAVAASASSALNWALVFSAAPATENYRWQQVYFNLLCIQSLKHT